MGMPSVTRLDDVVTFKRAVWWHAHRRGIPEPGTPLRVVGLLKRGRAEIREWEIVTLDPAGRRVNVYPDEVRPMKETAAAYVMQHPRPGDLVTLKSFVFEDYGEPAAAKGELLLVLDVVSAKQSMSDHVYETFTVHCQREGGARVKFYHFEVQVVSEAGA